MLAVDEHGNVEIVAQQSINSEQPEMNFDFIESFEEKIYGISAAGGDLTEQQQQQIPLQDVGNADNAEQASAIINSLNHLDVYVQSEHTGGQRRDGTLQVSQPNRITRRT
jgi:hypothetical protein